MNYFGTKATFQHRGFLPAQDPQRSFAANSPYRVLDEWGRRLPQWLQDPQFRPQLRKLNIPAWTGPLTPANLPQLRLYYMRLGFLASAYINQVGAATAHSLPANIARPLCAACALLQRPPVLSYDGYALYNWRRLDPNGPIALGNIDTLQNFVPLYDEHWFILVHVEIEAIAAQCLSAILDLARDDAFADTDRVNRAITQITQAVEQQIRVLQRIPERMSPELYFCRFRPYIRFFENVRYEGTKRQPLNFRGETGAQSSVMPSLVAFFKIPHQATALTDHLADMRNYMPTEHRTLLAFIQTLPAVRPVAERELFNAAMEAIARFREVHFQWAKRYIDEKVTDPRGTGGTPYMQWLQQLIHETRAFRK